MSGDEVAQARRALSRLQDIPGLDYSRDMAESELLTGKVVLVKARRPDETDVSLPYSVLWAIVDFIGSEEDPDALD